jgi:hypothetical protein
MSKSVVVLAAGQQTRFNAPQLKCMTVIGGESVLEHLTDRLRGMHRVLVVSNLWRDEDIAVAKNLGYEVITINSQSIGESVGAGVKACFDSDSIYVYSADTFIWQPNVIPMPFDDTEMLFDPWRWITVWQIFPKKFGPDFQWELITDRVRASVFLVMKTKMIDYPFWINLNTMDDVRKAEEQYDSCK